MPAFQSVVEAISIKPLSEPDRYGNTFRASVKFGEVWYSWGSLKKEEINFKNGSGWHRLTKGDEIEGMYKENGDWKNIQPKTVTLVSEGKGAPTPRVNPAVQYSGNMGAVNPAEIGQCMNLAAEVLGYSGEDMNNPDKAVQAIQWYKRTRQLFSSLYPTVDLEETLTEKPKPKPKAETPQYDDDEV